MNKFENELGNWQAAIKKYAAESAKISQKLRRLLKKNNSSEDIEDYIQLFGEFIIWFNIKSTIFRQFLLGT